MTKQPLTETEQNQLAVTVGILVALVLFLIWPPSREWIFTRATNTTNYVHDDILMPVVYQLGSWFTAAWNWLDGLLPW